MNRRQLLAAMLAAPIVGAPAPVLSWDELVMKINGVTIPGFVAIRYEHRCTYVAIGSGGSQCNR